MNDRAAWLEARRTGIGGSDAAAVLGISPWKTPLELYREKRGEIQDTRMTVPMEWGQLLEAPIVEMYRRRTGRAVVTGDAVQNLSGFMHPFMRCNLDGLVPDEHRIVEAKLASQDEDWGDPGTDQVPLYYVPQAQHCMAVTGEAFVDFAVLFARFGLRDLQIYTVPRDDELIEDLVKREREFWRRVVDGLPPDPTNADEIRMRWPSDNGSAVEAPIEIVAACDLLAQAKADEKSAKARCDDFARAIQMHMGEASELVFEGRTIATWKQAKPSRVLDVDLLTAGYPDIAARYMTDKAGSRRLLLK